MSIGGGESHAACGFGERRGGIRRAAGWTPADFALWGWCYILKYPRERKLDNSRLGSIGFDGDLFVAGKRAENVGSARG